MLSPRENYLEAVRFGRPDYVPLACEDIWFSFQFNGNFRMADWTDGWGVRWEMGLADTVPFPRGHPLTCLDALGDYRFPDPDALVLSEETAAALPAANRSERLVAGNLTYLLFERAWAIMGMDNFLAALITHPAEAHAFLHGIADYARRVFDRYLELGVDAIAFSEDLGTQRALTMSPAMFREFLLPEYRYCFQNALAAGAIIRFHSCGCVQEIAGDLAGIGVTVLNPVQARANDLAAIKSATAGRMALDGGIDTAVLAMGGPDDVRDVAGRIMSVLKPGGGYVCGPDQSIPGIPPENMTALWETARRLGRY